MMRLTMIIMIAGVAMSGCMAMTATPSTQGKAYVTTNSIFKGDMYYCDAREGRPECWVVKEAEAAP